MDDIDELLKERGAKWRASQPSPPALPAFALHRAAGSMRWLRLSVGLAVIAIVGVGSLSLLRPARTPAQTGGLAILSDGDAATGTGMLLVTASGQARLCIPEVTRLRMDDLPSCSKVAVDLSNVDVSGIPGARQQGGATFARSVTVTGRWTTGHLAVESITSATTPSASPAVPCNEPPEGWTRPDASEVQIEAATARLDGIVSTDPGRYSGVWSAMAPGGVLVQVVGVVGDPEIERSRLGAAYPYALCLTRAQYSARELETARTELANAHPSWSAAVIASLDRVEVRLSFVDSSAVNELARYPAVVPAPLVTKR